MRKKLSTLFITLLLLFSMTLLVQASSVTMSQSSATIQIGDTLQLQALADGAAAAAAWGSSDTDVATVSQSGLVTGKAAGSSVITAMVNGTSVECVVSVVKRSTTATTRYNVLILDTSKSMKGMPLKRVKTASKRFAKTVLGSDGTNYLAVITLNSSPKVVCNFTSDLKKINSCINKVTAKGDTNMNQSFKLADKLLSKISNGSGVMKNVILCSDGLPKYGSKSASGKYKSSDHKYYKYANAVYKTDSSMKKSGYFIYALGFFHNSSGKDLTFGKRLMKDLASKDKYYVITDNKDIDKVFNNIADTITKTTISKKSITLYVGETYQLNALENGSVTAASWSSKKNSIASVNQTGKVTAKKAGSTTITAKANGKTLKCKVTVKNKKQAASISLNPTTASVYVGNSIKLTAAVTGKSKKVTWSSSDKSIATVKNGKVTGKSYGTVTITAKANGKKATCTVNVLVTHPDYSQYFMIKPTVSNYGSAKINEYGVRLKTNDDAVIDKCAVYIYQSGSTVKRTIACTGTNIQYAYYVPYLAYNGTVKYDGDTSSQINTLALRRNYYTNIWSRSGNYTLITANLEDKNGKPLAIQSTGVQNENMRIFYDKNEMIKWLSE